VSSIPRHKLTFIGLDVHRDWISVGVLPPGTDEVAVDKIFHDEPSIRRLIDRLGECSRVRFCYEAGPTGYELARLMRSMGVACEVIAPSLIPKAPGDRVKTDKRDCRRLARLHRAGELTAIRVPTVAEEAVRDLCRTRVDMAQDLTRARHRLSKFLLRHGRVYRAGTPWTHRFDDWLGAQRFDHPALTETLAHYRSAVQVRQTSLVAVEADLAGWYDREPFADAVRRLAAYRGITHLGALTIASEVGDWRRFPRAAAFMGYAGLVPSEYSSGSKTSRGSLTKAGSSHLRWQLVESAWAYQHKPSLGVGLRRRQADVPPEVIARSWTAQQRLSNRFKTLAARKHNKSVVAAAIARELAGFVWAEMTADT
jgi:transposase